jgi:phage protein D
MPDTSVTSQSVSVYNATPTVKVNGQANDTVNAQLIAMTMRESEGGLTAMELQLGNVGTFTDGKVRFVFEDNAVLKLGATIEVAAGDQSAPTSIFKGKISAIEGVFPADSAPELCVLAEDALQSARLKRRTRVLDNVTLADLVSGIASTCSLTPNTTGLDTNVGTQVQLNESDLAFARRVLARYDIDLQVVADELHAAPRSQIQRNSIDISLENKLRRARVCADLAHQVTKVQLSTWDYHQGSVASATRDDNPPGPGSGQAGADLLRDAFGERAEQVANVSVRDSAEAQAVVDADWDQRSRRFVTLHGTSEGNPNLRVGSHLNVSGLGDRFSNTYYVVATTHRYTQESGYETDFTAQCAHLGGSSS